MTGLPTARPRPSTTDVADADALACELAGLAVWEWDLHDDRLRWSPRMHALHGIDEETFGGLFGDWTSLVLREDQARFGAEITWALTGQRPLHGEYRVRLKDGSIRRLEARARRIAGPDGGFGRLFGICRDVTEAGDALESLRRRESLIGHLGRISGVGGWELDLVTRKLLWTEETHRIHEVGSEFSPTLESAVLFYPAEAREKLLAAIGRSKESGERWQLELPFVTASGRERWVRAMGAAEFKHGQVSRLFGTIEDVTETRQARVEMQSAREAAETANRAKSDFLAVVSHELRTPLNGILGLSDLLMAGESAPERLEALGLIRTSGEHLLEVIQQVIEFSRIDSGSTRRHQAPFELPATLRSAFASHSARALAQGVAFRAVLPQDLPQTVVGDRDRLVELLSVFLDNACKFTERGVISVMTDILPCHPGHVRLAVRIADTGIGIPEARQADLFQPFAALDTSSTRRHGGLGMGLALARRICDLLGGTINLHSRPGFGTTVTITLDFRLPAGASTGPETAPAAPVTVPAPVTQSSPAAPSAPTPEPPPETGDSGRRLLVAEDNPTNQALLRHLLRRAGFDFEMVSDGAAAVEAVRTGRYGVVLMDVQMPVMTGIEATRAIRASIAGPCEPWIIALTAQAFDEDRRRCLEAGMNDFLAKPARLDQVRQAVERGFLARSA